jgi:hypothetical protein
MIARWRVRGWWRIARRWLAGWWVLLALAGVLVPVGVAGAGWCFSSVRRGSRLPCPARSTGPARRRRTPLRTLVPRPLRGGVLAQTRAARVPSRQLARSLRAGPGRRPPRRTTAWSFHGRRRRWCSCRYVGRSAWMEDLPMPGNAPPPAVGAFPYVPWFASGVVVRGLDLERLKQPSRRSCRYVGRSAWMEDLPMPGNAPPPAVGAFPYAPWFASGVVVPGSDLERLNQPSRGSCRYAWRCAQMGDLPMPGNAPPPAVGAFPYAPWFASGVVVRGSNLERLKQPSPEFSPLRSAECADGKAALPENTRL